ncbi:ABC transporter ATP-binding protein [Microbacterium trichothecenolyticum]|nr:ABC transporter ATP-binding protein [Microbacterium trichothecenolyticum]MBW9120561.1 ABC transporter ATP-binding protein [Microbacterium trichothecenolyticum]
MTALHVEGLTVATVTGRLIVQDVGFDVPAGRIVGLVGESGSGKSITSLALTGLLPASMRIVDGTARIGGRTFLERGKLVDRPGISMVFQNARSALNPTMRIGDQFERLLAHLNLARGGKAIPLIEQWFRDVGIVEPARVRRAYPHQLSGGMNQRVMIALALASEPELLIADEPTTGLDVTVQAQILRLLRRATAGSERGVLLITHDLGVVAQMCSETVVLYHGQVRESGTTDQIFHAPVDAYTRELIAAGRGALARTEEVR